MPFDLSMWKLMVLGVIALIVFGPDRLPQLARDAGRTLRQLREMAQAARTELKSELGDTVGDFDFSDLNPRTFVRKHLLDDLDGDLASPGPGRAAASGFGRRRDGGGRRSRAGPSRIRGTHRAGSVRPRRDLTQLRHRPVGSATPIDHKSSARPTCRTGLKPGGRRAPGAETARGGTVEGQRDHEGAGLHGRCRRAHGRYRQAPRPAPHQRGARRRRLRCCRRSRERARPDLPRRPDRARRDVAGHRQRDRGHRRRRRPAPAR